MCDIFDFIREDAITANDFTNNKQNFMNDLRDIENSKIIDKFNRLVLVNHALWEIIRDKLGVTDLDLAKKITDIDLRDGKLDGKITKKSPGECPKCHAGISREFNKCLFCGYVPPDSGSAFDNLTI